MRIDENGNVGIGTTTPNNKLHVSGGGISTDWAFQMKHYESTYGVNISRPFLNKQWSGTHGDYMYLGGTGNRSNTVQGAIMMTQSSGILFGKGSDNGDAISTEHMRIAASGNVGIGNTSPSTALHVGSLANSSWTNSILTAFNGSAYNVCYDGTRTAFFGVDASSNYGMAGTFSNHDFVLRTNNSERMRINTSGDVGIGTLTPNTRLSVVEPIAFNQLGVNPINAQVSIGSNGSQRLYLGTYYTASVGAASMIQSADFYSSVDNPSNLILQPIGGNVGIGTTAPSQKLDVNGNVEIPAANEYMYATAKTKYASVSAASFAPINGLQVDGTGTGNARWISNGTIGFADAMYATIQLPDEATITGLTVYVNDNDATYDLSANLVRLNMTSNTITTIITTSTTSGSPGLTSVTGTHAGSFVDNSNNSFFIKFNTRQNNTSLWIRGAMVTYTVTKAD